jgi:hypothetical protein
MKKFWIKRNLAIALVLLFPELLGCPGLDELA